MMQWERLGSMFVLSLCRPWPFAYREWSELGSSSCWGWMYVQGLVDGLLWVPRTVWKCVDQPINSCIMHCQVRTTSTIQTEPGKRWCSPSHRMQSLRFKVQTCHSTIVLLRHRDAAFGRRGVLCTRVNRTHIAHLLCNLQERRRSLQKPICS